MARTPEEIVRLLREDARWHRENGYHHLADTCTEAAHMIERMAEALLTTAGNIRSLGAARQLDQVPVPYRIWLAVVEAAARGEAYTASGRETAAGRETADAA